MSSDALHLLRLADDALAQRLDVAADRRQRRPELVRHGHEERTLELLGLGELRDHPTEALAQERDLVAAPRLGNLDVVAPGGDVLRRPGESPHGLGQTPREPEEEHGRERDADCEREREPAEKREPLLAQLGLGLRDDQPPERLGALDELHRLRSGDQPSALARRRELDDHLPVAIELGAAERAPRQAREAEPLPREQRSADVVELVACRELELLGGELRRLRALVGRAERRLRVERRETRRFAPELLDRLLRASRPGRAAPRAPIDTRPKTRTTARNRAVRRNRSVPSMDPG